MLDLFEIPPAYGNQQLLFKERANRIFKGIDFLQAIATDGNERCSLILYRRNNPAGYKETGIYYGPGPKSEYWGDDFPSEMLRIFSNSEEDLIRAERRYATLVQENGYHFVCLDSLSYRIMEKIIIDWPKNIFYGLMKMMTT